MRTRLPANPGLLGGLATFYQPTGLDHGQKQACGINKEVWMLIVKQLQATRLRKTITTLRGPSRVLLQSAMHNACHRCAFTCFPLCTARGKAQGSVQGMPPVLKSASGTPLEGSQVRRMAPPPPIDTHDCHALCICPAT